MRSSTIDARQSNGTSMRRQVLFACAMVAIVGLIAASEDLHSRSQDLIAACEAIISGYPRLGMIVFVLLASASAMLAFFSSAILVPVGIYAWGASTCFLLLWLGWFLGGVLAYLVGMSVGRAVVERLVGERRLGKLEKRVSRNASFVHIVLFQAMLPSEIPGYVLGSLRYSFPMFAAALALVEMPYAVGTIYIGESFLEGRGWVLVALAAAAALSISIAVTLVHRRRRPAPVSD